MRAARDEMDAGIEPESELEERSLSMDEISIKSRPLSYSEYLQNKQGTLQVLTLCKTVNGVPQLLVSENQALQG